MTVRDDYPLLARLEARERSDPPATVVELTRLLDELDAARLDVATFTEQQ